MKKTMTSFISFNNSIWESLQNFNAAVKNKDDILIIESDSREMHKGKTQMTNFRRNFSEITYYLPSGTFFVHKYFITKYSTVFYDYQQKERLQ